MPSTHALRKSLQLVALSAFAAGSIACGDITLPQTLALTGEENAIELTIPAGLPEPNAVIDLEGGVATTIALSIDLFDLLFQKSIFGVVTVDDLLFAGNGFVILGTPTGDICVTLDEAQPGGGTVVVDLKESEILFDLDLATAILVTNPALAGLLPDGFPFVITVASSQDLSLADLLGLALGNSDGGLEVSQSFSEVFEVEVIPGVPLAIGAEGSFTLATANELPTSDRLAFCEDYIAGP